MEEKDEENALLSELDEENTTPSTRGGPWSAIDDMQKSIAAMAESIHEIYKQNC